MKVSIHQPNYLPWTGLIHKIANSDIFIIFDDVQLPRGKSYTIRTKIKTSGGSKWITVPVLGKSDFLPINEIKINNEISWREEHWRKIEENYKNAPFFNQFGQIIKKTLFKKYEKLSEQNLNLIKTILGLLDIKKEILFSSEFKINTSGTQKIIELLKKVKADEYLTGYGEGSKRYVINHKPVFEKNNIKINIQNFKEEKYQQLHGEFVPNLSSLDMIFNIGPVEALKKLNLNKRS